MVRSTRRSFPRPTSTLRLWLAGAIGENPDPAALSAVGATRVRVDAAIATVRLTHPPRQAPRGAPPPTPLGGYAAHARVSGPVDYRRARWSMLKWHGRNPDTLRPHLRHFAQRTLRKVPGKRSALLRLESSTPLQSQEAAAAAPFHGRLQASSGPGVVARSCTSVPMLAVPGTLTSKMKGVISGVITGSSVPAVP